MSVKGGCSLTGSVTRAEGSAGLAERPSLKVRENPELGNGGTVQDKCIEKKTKNIL